MGQELSMVYPGQCRVLCRDGSCLATGIRRPAKFSASPANVSQRAVCIFSWLHFSGGVRKL
jgi:hypothetical protein